MSQKFQKYDLVRMADEYPPQGLVDRVGGKGQMAIVIGSYEDQYGGKPDERGPQYTLQFQGSGESSWYDECLMKRISRGSAALSNRWEFERKDSNSPHIPMNVYCSNCWGQVSCARCSNTNREPCPFEEVWGAGG